MLQILLSVLQSYHFHFLIYLLLLNLVHHQMLWLLLVHLFPLHTLFRAAFASPAASATPDYKTSPKGGGNTGGRNRSPRGQVLNVVRLTNGRRKHRIQEDAADHLQVKFSSFGCNQTDGRRKVKHRNLKMQPITCRSRVLVLKVDSFEGNQTISGQVLVLKDAGDIMILTFSI